MFRHAAISIERAIPPKRLLITGQETPRPHPNVAGRRPNRQTRGALLGEVRVWSAEAIGHARRRRAVHGHALPPIWRPEGVSGAPADGSARLRPAAPGPSSSAPPHARRPGPTRWRGRKGRHLSVGVEEENAVARSLATRPVAGTVRCMLDRHEQRWTTSPHEHSRSGNPDRRPDPRWWRDPSPAG